MSKPASRRSSDASAGAGRPKEFSAAQPAVEWQVRGRCTKTHHRSLPVRWRDL
jgi:hypothetical protein